MLYFTGLLDNAYGCHSVEEENTYSASPPGQSAQQIVDKNVSIKEHPTTPPNSPSISSTNHSFLQAGTPKDQHKESGSSANETIDLQIDYWIQSKLNDVSNKKNDYCKVTMKSSFRNLHISRLPLLGEASSSSLTLYYVTKEKKQKSKTLKEKKSIPFSLK